MIAEKYKLTRDELDKISGHSHEAAAEAIKSGNCSLRFYNMETLNLVLGHFKKEILPIKVKKPDGTEVLVDKDEGVRVPVVQSMTF